MTKKDIVLSAIDHKAADKVPYQIEFTHDAYKKMIAYYDDENFYRNRLDNCITPTIANLPDKEISPGIFEDRFGSVWNKTIDRDIGVVENRVVTEENVDDFQFPDVDDPTVYRFAEAAVAGNPDEFVVFYNGFSLYERAWVLAGMEPVLMGMAADPDFVNRLLDRIVEYNLTLMDRACRAGVDAVWIGDDWGQQTGLIMGPQHWREFIKPRLKTLYDAVKAHGKKVIIHCCGKVDGIMPELIELGVDLFNPFQPEVMDVYEMKKEYGKDIAFWGGISTQKLLPFGTVQQVKDEVRRLLDEIGRDGGYIVAPAHAIPSDAKPENIDAMLEVLNDQ
ncbi:MAG: hypothetical protein GY866_16475 [Proteobacteria bacterium]|nr:hypothetical protein [Pseudomonadota bacterium]